MTTNDVRAEVTVESHSVLQQQEMAAESGGSDVLSGLHPTHSWIVVRQAKIDAEKARESGNSSATLDDFIPKAEEGEHKEIVKQNHNFDITWQIGGATTLAGAAYFEFFTWLMLGTAIVFVIVGYFYKPKTYIQDEGMVSATATLE
jgi:POT family proton-dependent oligopeptide transporter